ncbi:MAG: HAD family hydrolase [Betaproteobacteria bacterium]|nr:HAD family hydrolase [Betaproteobacteria bacterium]
MNLTLFDLDGTLIEIDSDHAFGDFMVQNEWVDPVDFKRRNDAFYADYQAGRLNLPAYVAFATAGWRQRPLAQSLALRERFMREVMRPALRPGAKSLVEQHRQAGDLMAIVTATNEFVTEPIAQAFGIEHLIALQLQRDANGQTTGMIRGTPTFREGKITRVLDWLSGLGHTSGREGFDRVTVYSDSINDLPLLEWATHPVATNPAPSLADVAQQRGWPILRLFT